MLLNKYMSTTQLIFDIEVICVNKVIKIGKNSQYS